MTTIDTLTTPQLEQLVKAYARGRDDALCLPPAPCSAADAALLEIVHATWMRGLCRASAGLLPFDDTHDARAPDWLRRAQEGRG